MADAPPPNDTAGHRARLRARLLESKGAALADYELLEYLLMLGLPRVDTKPLAKALLKEFGDLRRVLTAKPDELARVKGMGEGGAGALVIARATAQALLAAPLHDAPMLASWQALLDYLRADMAWLVHERVRVLHLDSKNTLMRDEIVSEGSVDQANVHVREIIKRALEIGSSGLILVHNHPSGDPQPSRADIQLTREIVEAGKRLNIAVHDHVIIGANGHTSLRAQGLM
ncbi:RadC family protein [Sphingomonas sp. SUN039]|uniref:RadC family protein n=1 Tax=Sphingomonas sp. SUN039 TaxID=2937787 RepID=UPI002164CE5A|nr:DNA repair protein RadC [Sphingomonas sp. SUN039]UVO54025.1 DNA repair protein RadC [Sphingomonas sp. SUN039]